MKKCPRCRRDLELRDYRVEKYRPGGRDDVCARCRRLQHAAKMRARLGPDYVYQPKKDGKLPSYSVVKALYLSGATYPEIAKLYDIQWASSVAAYLKRHARRHGDPWPFERPWYPRRRNDHLVDAAIIADLIRAATEAQGISANRWSLTHNVCPSTVSYLLRNPVQLRLKSAKRLLVALDEPVPPWIESTLRADARRKSVASGVSRATDSEVVRNLEIVDREEDAGVLLRR